MKEYRADIGALQLLQITVCLLASLLCAASSLFLDPWPILMWILVGVFAGLACIVCFFCLPMFFRQLRCVVTEERVTSTVGIFFRREQSVRLDRVQYVQIVTGPFDGILGLNFIILHVFGGQLVMLFLNKKDRLEIAGHLQNKGVFYAS